MNKNTKIVLEKVFEILRECAYEFDDCETSEECIENLIQDIKDNYED